VGREAGSSGATRSGAVTGVAGSLVDGRSPLAHSDTSRLTFLTNRPARAQCIHERLPFTHNT